MIRKSALWPPISISVFYDFWASWPLKMERKGYPERPVRNYFTLHNIQQERRSYLHRGGSLKSRDYERKGICAGNRYIGRGGGTE